VTTRLLGRRVRIRSSDRAVGEYLTAILDGASRVPAPDEPTLELRIASGAEGELGIWIDGALASDTVAAAEAPSLALALLNRWLCFRPGALVVVHAAAAARRGEAVVLVGESGAGKSTLVAGLTRGGWTYLSDEAAGVDAHGRVHPYARPIVLRPGSWSAFTEVVPHLPPGHERFATTEWHVPASLLGSVANAPMPAKAIVFVRHRENVPAELRSIGRSEALERMITEACNLDAAGQEGLDRLAGVVRRSDCYELAFADLPEALAALDAVA